MAHFQSQEEKNIYRTNSKQTEQCRLPHTRLDQSESSNPSNPVPGVSWAEVGDQSSVERKKKKNGACCVAVVRLSERSAAVWSWIDGPPLAFHHVLSKVETLHFSSPNLFLFGNNRVNSVTKKKEKRKKVTKKKSSSLLCAEKGFHICVGKCRGTFTRFYSRSAPALPGTAPFPVALSYPLEPAPPSL